jgi:SAM-dependent methyltransferase
MTDRAPEQSWFFAREYQDFHRTAVSRFVESVAPSVPAGAVIIDAGAGEAWYKPLFSHARYIGLDYAVGDAAWDYSKLDVVCDLHVVPLKTNSVSFALCTQTLEHVQQPHTVLTELSRILAPGGTLFCSLPFIGDAHHQEPHDFFRYTRYAVDYLFKMAGFTNVEVTPIGGYNTLLVSLIQKGMHRYQERHANRPRIVTMPIAFLQKFLFLLTRWANKLAWTQDQKDPDRYRYAMGFTVIAKK